MTINLLDLAHVEITVPDAEEALYYSNFFAIISITKL